MMTFRTNGRLVPVVLLLTGALSLSACSGGEPSPSPSPSPSVSASATTSVSATSTPSSSPKKSETAEQRNARLAGEAIVAFWAKQDELASDPRPPLTELATVARGQALMQWQRNLTDMRSKGRKTVGRVTVEASPGVLDTETKLYQVSACVDVTKVNVVDKDGKSVVSAERLPRTRYTYKVQEDDGQFFVVEDLLKGKPC